MAAVRGDNGGGEPGDAAGGGGAARRPRLWMHRSAAAAGLSAGAASGLLGSDRAVDLSLASMDIPVNHTAPQFSIWSYVGGILLIYGLLLLAGGAYQIWHTPATVLAKYHATLCVGVVLTIAGVAFAYCPMRNRRNRQEKGEKTGC